MRFRNLTLVLLCAACAGPRLARVPVPRTAPEPPAAPRWAEPKLAPAAPQPEAAPGSPTDDAATRAWLEKTIEQRRAANPDTPPVPMQQVVERTVYVDQQGNAYQPSAPHETPFPVNTAVGAGVGAAIGSYSCNAGEGAAIGAGIGLMFDLLRWTY